MLQTQIRRDSRGWAPHLPVAISVSSTLRSDISQSSAVASVAAEFNWGSSAGVVNNSVDFIALPRSDVEVGAVTSKGL